MRAVFAAGDEGADLSVRDPAIEGEDRVANARPHPGAKLRSRCAGERHHQDLVDAQMALQQQPQEQRGNGVRLAGSGTGFDQTPTLERDLEDVQRFHRVTSCVRWRSSGANTCCEASTKVGKPAKGR